MIGNGFDLAHGLKTTYTDFISNFWEQTIKDVQKNRFNSPFENDYLKIDKTPEFWGQSYTYKDFLASLNYSSSSIRFKNKFLQVVTEKNEFLNWVDIENVYYDLLKSSYKIPASAFNIEELNSEFNFLKEKLINYLIDIETEFQNIFSDKEIENQIGSKIYSKIKIQDLTENAISNIADKEYKRLSNSIEGIERLYINYEDLTEGDGYIIKRILSSDDRLKAIKRLLYSNLAPKYFDFQPEQILFLSFNYTKTENLYLDSSKFNFTFKQGNRNECIHIHGTLTKIDENPVVFGFGDEIDEDYKSIENLNNNKYLENIKSIKYLETDNYKKLLEFLNTDDFQIFIFGHSCGISDRTLLNTLFEHEKCISIKPFYHNNSIDNFSDIVRNISRNFTNKSVMRDKVVNKLYCEPIVG